MKKLYEILILCFSWFAVQAMDKYDLPGEDKRLLQQACAILEINPEHLKDSEDPIKIIEQAYRKRALFCHPDKNINLPAEEQKQREEMFKLLEPSKKYLLQQYVQHSIWNSFSNEEEMLAEIEKSEKICMASLRSLLIRGMGNIGIITSLAMLTRYAVGKYSISSKMLISGAHLIALGTGAVQYISGDKASIKSFITNIACNSVFLYFKLNKLALFNALLIASNSVCFDMQKCLSEYKEKCSAFEQLKKEHLARKYRTKT